MSNIPASIHLSSSATPPRRRVARLWVVIPLLVFCGIAALLLVRLGAGDPSLVPSALIGRSVPQFALKPLEGLSTSGPPGLSSADLRRGHVTILNVFASWCVECREEEGALMALASDPTLQRRGVKLTGIVYKDDPKMRWPISSLTATRSHRSALTARAERESISVSMAFPRPT